MILQGKEYAGERGHGAEGEMTMTLVEFEKYA